MLDDAVFIKGMTVLGAAYPDYQIKDDTIDIYRSFLNRLTPIAFEHAIRLHIIKKAWFPKINELLEAASTLESPQPCKDPSCPRCHGIGTYETAPNLYSPCYGVENGKKTAHA